jgi:hypothetical protein
MANYNHIYKITESAEHLGRLTVALHKAALDISKMADPAPRLKAWANHVRKNGYYGVNLRQIMFMVLAESPSLIGMVSQADLSVADENAYAATLQSAVNQVVLVLPAKV